MNQQDDVRLPHQADRDTYQENEDDQAELDVDSSQPIGVRDGDAVSGEEPDPESDDDTLENAHDVGIATDADLDNPRPLNIAHDVEEAEKRHRSN